MRVYFAAYVLSTAYAAQQSNAAAWGLVVRRGRSGQKRFVLACLRPSAVEPRRKYARASVGGCVSEHLGPRAGAFVLGERDKDLWTQRCAVHMRYFTRTQSVLRFSGPGADMWALLHMDAR